MEFVTSLLETHSAIPGCAFDVWLEDDHTEYALQKLVMLPMSLGSEVGRNLLEIGYSQARKEAHCNLIYGPVSYSGRVEKARDQLALDARCGLADISQLILHPLYVEIEVENLVEREYDFVHDLSHHPA